MHLTLVESEHRTGDVWSFRFEPSEPLSWIAGQFVEVELDHDDPDDEGTRRWFTISAAPHERYLEITTRVTRSSFKRALAALTPGSRLELVAEPDGDFIWTDTDRPVIFVAGGIGITPFRSILSDRLHHRRGTRLTLVYGSRGDTFPFRDEFEAIARNDATFNLRLLPGEPVTVERLTERCPALTQSLVYLSGPEPIVEHVGDANGERTARRSTKAGFLSALRGIGLLAQVRCVGVPSTARPCLVPSCCSPRPRRSERNLRSRTTPVRVSARAW